MVASETVTAETADIVDTVTMTTDVWDQSAFVYVWTTPPHIAAIVIASSLHNNNNNNNNNILITLKYRLAYEVQIRTSHCQTEMLLACFWRYSTDVCWSQGHVAACQTVPNNGIINIETAVFITCPCWCPSTDNVGMQYSASQVWRCGSRPRHLYMMTDVSRWSVAGLSQCKCTGLA